MTSSCNLSGGGARFDGSLYQQANEETALLNTGYLAKSLLRALLIAVILVTCLAIAMAVGLALAGFGYLGTCQDGTCQLVAAVYIMPLGGVGLFVIALAIWAIMKTRSRRRADQKAPGE